MALPHIAALSQALEFAPTATAAASGVTNAFASLLQKAVGKSEETTTPKSNPTTPPPGLQRPNLNIPSLEKQTESLIQGLHTFVRQMLSENGINLNAGTHLQLDDMGKIRVSGQHPDALQIENLLATQPELADMMQVIAANSQLLKAADETKAFQQQYTLDPAAAVANRPHLFATNAGAPASTFDLYLDSLRTEASFRRPGN